jgi:phosphoribosylanthranilate isomerase
MMVKICGVTRVEDAEMAVSLGATAVGFIFWPGSPRRISTADAAAISAALPDDVWKVGVFVDAPADDIRRVIEDAHLTAAQLHGSETPAFAAALATRVIKALALERASEPAALDEWRGIPILLDAHDPVRKGGTGRTIDWQRAGDIAAGREVILAGGLRPDNVVDAIARVRPYGIDVSSGVEVSPGVKDHDKLRTLFEALRSIDVGRGISPVIGRT